jgi:hypothetical protein
VKVVMRKWKNDNEKHKRNKMDYEGAKVVMRK